MRGGEELDDLDRFITATLSEAQLAELARRFAEAMNKPRKYRILSSPLPRRTSLRLWRRHQIDRTAIWLVDHVHWRAGGWLWRVTGLWNARRRKP